MSTLLFSGTVGGGDLEVHRVHLADVIQPETSPQAGDRCPIFAYAIRHPGGILLFDTGLGERIPTSITCTNPRDALSTARSTLSDSTSLP
jgi:hypothetical protein